MNTAGIENMTSRARRPNGKRGWKSIFFIALISLLFMPSCIEPYFADIEAEPDLISIEASLIRGAIRQTVKISRTSSLSNPRFVPVSGSTVTLQDDQGNEFIYEEYQSGYYVVDMLEEDIVTGRKYRLQITTRNGNEYASDYEEMEVGVPIDSVYFMIENRLSEETNEEVAGLQFYVDVEAPDSLSRFFRWKMLETYEYTSAGPIDYFYWDLSLTPEPPADIWGLFRCWMTEEPEGIFLSNTVNLTVNEKKQIPLHYVSSETDRLKIRYSLAIDQFSLNEEAYNYFNQNKIATDEGGGLYTQQPQQPLTNFYNVNDTTKRVIGYFWLSEKSSKRIFVNRIESLNVKDHFYPVEIFNLEDHGDGPFPIYIMEQGGVRMTGGPYCFDCTRRGGTTTRPDFW